MINLGLEDGVFVHLPIGFAVPCLSFELFFNRFPYMMEVATATTLPKMVLPGPQEAAGFCGEECLPWKSAQLQCLRWCLATNHIWC